VLEYPIGKPIYRSVNNLTMPRVSPDGERVAVIEGGGVPTVIAIDRSGKKTELSRNWIFADSLAWHPSGKELWVVGVGTSEPAGPLMALWGLDLGGHRRIVAPLTDLEVLHDIARDGRVLVERELNTREILFGSAGGGERDLSWLDQSSLAVLSRDGKTLLFDEQGEGGGPNGSVYLRPTDGGPAVRLGDGGADDLSPDGRWALTRSFSKDGIRLVLLPTATGEPKALAIDGLQVRGGGFAPPDGKRILFAASEPGKGSRAYVLDLAGGKPRAFTPEGLTGGGAASPDGKSMALNDAERRPTIYPIDGGDPKPIPGLDPGDSPIQWSQDGGTLYVTREGEVPRPIYRYSFATGKKSLWKELVPADRAGLVRIEAVWLTPDGAHYAYSINRVTASDLFVVTGWK
jgi:eukaryotic-like serine/threonine-protein kinase